MTFSSRPTSMFDGSSHRSRSRLLEIPEGRQGLGERVAAAELCTSEYVGSLDRVSLSSPSSSSENEPGWESAARRESEVLAVVGLRVEARGDQGARTIFLKVQVTFSLGEKVMFEAASRPSRWPNSDPSPGHRLGEE